MREGDRDLLVTNIGQLLTMRSLTGSKGPRKGRQMGEIGLIGPQAAILVRGQRIVKVGIHQEVTRHLKKGSFYEIDAAGKVVMPGFVDSHTHGLFAQSRIRDFEMRLKGATYEEIAKNAGGIRSSVRSLREAEADFLTVELERWCRRALEHGITTMEVKSGYGLDLESERKMLLVIRRAHASIELVPTFLGAHAVPEEFSGRQDQYVEFVCAQMLPALRSLAVFCDVFCDKGYFTLKETRRILESAIRFEYKIKLHAEQLHFTGAADLGHDLKAVSLDHLDSLTFRQMDRLARSSSVGTLLPGANFFLGAKRYPPAREMISRGMGLALATDFNPGTSPTVNMGLICSIAATQMKMTPQEVLVASTINGAHALDWAQRVGSIESGKQADILWFDVRDFREIPYYFGVNLVFGVIKNGIVQRWGHI